MRNFFKNRHIKYWKNRVMDWKQGYWADHPHRELIIKALRGMNFGSVVEFGCASGYNLHKIRQNFPHSEIGGIDISEEAIETAKKLLPDDTAVLEVSSADSVFLSDKSSDVVLTDMVLIYFDPMSIKNVLEEMRRVARKYVILVEFHHTNWLKRLALRLLTGYNSYNYRKLLLKHNFHDLEFYKLTEKDWPGGNPQKEFGWLIVGKV